MSGDKISSRHDVITEALAACRPHLIYAAIFSGLVNLLYLAPSLYMLQVYDRVVTTRGNTTLFYLTLILGFALICSALLDHARMQMLQKASARLEIRGAAELLDHILGRNSGRPVQRAQAMRDFDMLRQTLSGPPVIALLDAPWAPVYIFVCFLLHPWIGVFALASALILGVIAWAGERANAGKIKQSTEQSNIAYQLQEFSIRASEVVRALGMRRAVVAKHIAQRSHVVAVQGDVTASSGRYLAITKFWRMFLQSLALGLGALLAINGMISAGAIFAASLLITRALAPIEQILGAMKNMLQARTAYRDLSALAAEAARREHLPTLPAPKGVLEAEAVGVLTPSRDGRILSDISFAAQPGEVIALIGPSGSGKSTLLRALSGGLAPDSGTVRIDGAKYADWDLDRLAQHMGYLPQDPTLFPGSVHANICRFENSLIGDDPAIDEKVVAAAQAAGAHDMILRLPQGYATELSGSGGVSAGQAQRIALARALYNDPVVLLLDEPNAHLDGEGDAKLLQTLAAMRARGATVIISAHRTGILAVTDKIMVMRDGRMVVFGPRDELMKAQGPASPAVTDNAGATMRDDLPAEEAAE
jgi:PrtD family type I secretion system ABC transporter